MGGTAAEFQEQVHKAQERWQRPGGAREILLIRHGSSVGRTVDTVQLGALTISDPVLSRQGEQQAGALARHLAGEAITAIFVTPLRRTQQTAAPLAAALGLDPVVVADLREVHMGDWEHSFYDHAEAGHPLVGRMMAEESWEVLPNAEPAAAVAARAQAGIAAIVAATAPGAVSAAFCHAAIIAELCRQATGSRPFAFMAPENTSVTRLVVMADGRWKLRSFNDMAHLGY
jgi:probable phosphoglycerate mutase